MFKENIRYVEKWKSWLIWNGEHWKEKSDVAMLPLARAATEFMFKQANDLDEDTRAVLRKHAMKSQSGKCLQAILLLAKGEENIRIDADRLDADPLLLGCPNGTLDLKMGTMREPRREDYILKQIAVDYDPNAICPDFLKFLAWACKRDKDLIEHLQRVAGYTLTGEVGEEKMFIYFGGGDNGKTTLMMTLFILMGSYAFKCRRDLLLSPQGEKGAASPDVAALQGVRLALVSGTDDGCRLAEPRVKQITSNDSKLEARRLHKDTFNFTPSHKTHLMTNHRPTITETDDGVWRRMNIIGFHAKLTEKEKDINFRQKRLLPELPGILKWAVEGCLKWQRDGLKVPKAVRRAVSSYRSEMDLVRQWIEERCQLDKAAFTTSSDLYLNYKFWSMGENEFTFTNKRFSSELVSRGSKSTR